MQWPKEKGQKFKQRSMHNIKQKPKEWSPRTPLKTGSELRFSGRIFRSCTTRGTRHISLVTNPVISHKWVPEYNEHGHNKCTLCCQFLIDWPFGILFTFICADSEYFLFPGKRFHKAIHKNVVIENSGCTNLRI